MSPAHLAVIGAALHQHLKQAALDLNTPEGRVDLLQLMSVVGAPAFGIVGAEAGNATGRGLGAAFKPTHKTKWGNRGSVAGGIAGLLTPAAMFMPHADEFAQMYSLEEQLRMAQAKAPGLAGGATGAALGAGLSNLIPGVKSTVSRNLLGAMLGGAAGYGLERKLVG